MSQPVLLLVLRLLSALALLAFLGFMAWLMLKDLEAISEHRRAPPTVAGRLIVLPGEEASPLDGREIPLQPLTTIGRSPTNTIVLEDDYTSSEHALITLRGQQWWLEDLGSRNGTLLNDLPLESAAVVATGDTITIGRTRLKVEL